MSQKDHFLAFRVIDSFISAHVWIAASFIGSGNAKITNI